MRKSDLKQGMIITLESGIRLYVVNSDFAMANTLWADLGGFNEDFSHPIANCDIVKVEQTTENGDLNYLLTKCPTTVLWERLDWTKVPVDTKVFVRDYDTQPWHSKYFAKYEDGSFYVFSNGRTSFSDEGNNEITKWSQAKLAEEY